jgi:hypothetical protein
LKQHNNSGKKSEPTSKRTKSPGTVRRDTKEVLAERVAKLKERLNSKKVCTGALKRPIQSADRSMATVGWRRPEFPRGLGSKQIQNVL